jgi:hypothetical protein
MTTKAIPLFGGTFLKNSSMASNPPAEAPMQIMGKDAGAKPWPFSCLREGGAAREWALRIFLPEVDFKERFTEVPSIFDPGNAPCLAGWINGKYRLRVGDGKKKIPSAQGANSICKFAKNQR